jgi:hypothetical protein
MGMTKGLWGTGAEAPRGDWLGGRVEAREQQKSNDRRRRPEGAVRRRCRPRLSAMREQGDTWKTI